MNCDHATIGAPDAVEFFPCCHRYKRGDRCLTSVSKVIGIWPEKASWDNGDPYVMERVQDANARGVEVDSMLCDWLAGKLAGEIPVDVYRQDAADLFVKLMNWWPFGANVKTQVILNDGEIAGMADLVVASPSGIWDLKCVSELQPTYPLQIGGYVHLYHAEYGKYPERCGNIHVKKSLKVPKLVEYEPMTVASEFRIVRDMWRLVKRKKASA